MLEWKTKDDLLAAMTKNILIKKAHVTKRNGNSISLRPIIYDCIRSCFFQIFDYVPIMPDNLAVDFGFYFTGPIGSTIHEIYQDLLGLTGQRFTEQLVTFKSFDPILQIRSRCDGIDLRDKDNIILYEFKTKNNLPSKPYPEELLQNLLSVILYNAEYELNIRGSSMVYISRNDPLNNVVFFNYDFADPTNSPNPLDMKKELAPLMNKISEILQSIESKTVPSKDSKHIKKFAYGKPTCPICVYRTYCEKE